MKKSNKDVFFYTIALILVLIITVFAINHSYFLGMFEESDELYAKAESVLSGYISDSRKATGDGAVVPSEKRLSQQVTVTAQNMMVPIGGTVNKCRDDFYPGTYEVKFSDKKFLGSKATVSISIDVDPGEMIYVLTGDRNSGYRNYATIEVSSENIISFETRVIQDYTISKTDIVKAQKAMEILLSSNK